ncbi:EcoKI restriction-modification system protein HsdS [Clostridium saccharobutylicum]|uniref:restriction endonuclease subunit S n=1 Tax=Clostridium saccharobutylicum TaxID=169679 RepID=UPI000983DF18|nr:restriction endonuclease subunit S [Clostridium saccharobutylicum]AQS09904.1 EcoKI restriction-modification system protein HsdS [Clostridium saccharobutylicum]MBC2437046.1 restriction endonuclease subunit S [Clostridium saccharobutylicum]NSB89499.1 type I restriction enzyme S subunit [Clostridium saccharobutylicum]NYC27689.1 type I restriction enzyme S subunit [Clostridium saccharobutylicum]OOM12771.1 EcoKI restriction-modification system protein HsdS [Clostridium saccharobutylicum]
MNNELRPYEEYKKINLLWIDKIPNHWKVVGNRTLWAERKTQNCINEELLSVTIKKGIIKQSDLLKNTSKKDSSNLDKSKYKLVLPNDIAYNKMRMWQGAVGASKYKGIVSPAYIILKPISEFNPRYYHYLMRTPDYIEESHRYSYGMCDDQLNLRYEDFKQMKIIKPPIEEQDTVVKYLDFQLAKINKFIKAKKKLIEALKEQKQAVINEAVTKGINPNAKMKLSDIAWLGDIPAHWKCGKIKNYAKLSPSKGKEFYKSDLNDKVVFLPMEKISIYGDIDNSDKRIINEVKNGFTYFEKDDVVVAKITPCFENGKGACLDKLESDFGFGTTELVVLRANKHMLPQYLYLITRTSYFRILGEEVMTGSAGQKRIPTEFISNFKLGIPDIIEQKNIIDFIYKRIDKIEQGIVGVEKEIKLITEYRTTLISNVVTGKVDVRHIIIDDILEEDTEIDETEDEIIESEEDINIGESED